MIAHIVQFFSKRHLLTNLIFITVLVGGYFAWHDTKKEELPDITFDRVRISVNYPGATAEEVEYFVTREIEKAVRGVEGIYRITSNSSQGSTQITVELEKDFPDKNESIAELKNAVLDVDLPDEIRDDPDIRVFKTSKKAIVDIAILNKEIHLLDTVSRKNLQVHVLALENYLLSLPEINSISRSGYLKNELQVNVDPEKLTEFRIPLSQIIREVRDGHVRMPAGHIEAKNEPQVTLNASLDTVESLRELIIQAGFQGQAVKLKDVALVREDFNSEKEIIKVNGREAVMLNVVKNSSFGILESIEAVNKAVASYAEYQLKGSAYEIVLLDDESADVRNRLSIIAANGLVGFVLILGILFLFLNVKSGFWVAMGIPFCLAFTVICGNLLGYTINNTTLAAVIIVMGIVVDDAIIVAENISRRRSLGMSSAEAAVKGTAEIFWPIFASILTTCIAFVPLFYFSGRFGELNKFIPPIIFLMLGASLIESLIILPGHMHFEIPSKKNHLIREKQTQKNRFLIVENIFSFVLKHLLTWRYVVIVLFCALIVWGVQLAREKMKFVMFPDEETKEIVITGTTSPTSGRLDTARISQLIENELSGFLGKEVTGYRTEIAKGRRGGAVEENKFRTIVEIVPKEQRTLSSDELISLWEPKIGQMPELQKVMIQKNRFGQDSGSAIEIMVQENDNSARAHVANVIVQWLKKQSYFTNVDILQPVEVPEYKISLDREKIKRLAMNPVDIANTFRASLEGIVVYEIPRGDEEADVKISVIENAKKDIEDILNIPVENNREYLVPLRDIVKINKTTTPQSIARQDEKRTTLVYADLSEESNITPLEAADHIENQVFREMNRQFPSTILSFAGEIRDSRESRQDLITASIVVVVLIFNVLAILLNSLLQPLLIMIAIPFGMIGVIFAFILHGKLLFGFFAAVGVLGLSGVVINDSIVLLDKLNKVFWQEGLEPSKQNIADVTKTRLRAILLTTLTTVAGLIPTAYGIYGFDNMLSDMMLAMIWGLSFGTVVTLILIPCLFRVSIDLKVLFTGSTHDSH